MRLFSTFFGIMFSALAFSLSVAEELACDQEGSLLSTRTRAAASVSFTNNASQNIKIHWLNFSGGRTFYQTIAPGANYTQGTFIGHPWLISDDNDRCISIFVPREASENIDITDTTFSNATAGPATAEQVENLFNIVEQLYPQYFSPAATSQIIENWTFRHYSQTGIYLGTQSRDIVYLTGGEFGQQLFQVGRVLDLLELFTPDDVSNAVLTFTRPVDQRIDAGFAMPEAALNFQEGQSIEFVWDEQSHITVNGVRFDFRADGGSSWVYFRGTAPSISEVTVFKDITGARPTPSGISINIVDNSNPFAIVFTSYSFAP